MMELHQPGTFRGYYRTALAKRSVAPTAEFVLNSNFTNLYTGRERIQASDAVRVPERICRHRLARIH